MRFSAINYFIKKKQIFCFIAFILSFQSFAQFKTGHFYTKDGNKIAGLLKFNYGGSLFTDKSDGDCSVSFKQSKGDKKQKLTTNDICCFVIEKDSFAIIENFRLNSFASYPKDFAKVLQSGKINLYLYYSTTQNQNGGSFTNTDWVIEKDGAFDKLNRRTFKEVMPTYLSDFPELAQKVSNKELWYEDSEKIIKLYNDHFRVDLNVK